MRRHSAGRCRRRRRGAVDAGRRDAGGQRPCGGRRLHGVHAVRRVHERVRLAGLAAGRHEQLDGDGRDDVRLGVRRHHAAQVGLHIGTRMKTSVSNCCYAYHTTAIIGAMAVNTLA